MPEPYPPSSPSTLSKWQRFALWFSANRTQIGGLLTSIAGLLVLFDDHPMFKAGADVLIHAAALVTGVAGIGTMAAGMFKSDDFHKERREIVEAQAQGIPVMRLGRRADDSGEPFIMHFCDDDSRQRRTLKPGEVCPLCGFPSKPAPEQVTSATPQPKE